MMLAAVADTPYKIMLVAHILAVVVAFSPAFVHSVLTKQLDGLESEHRRAVLTMMAANGRRIYAPALIVAGLLGFGLQGMSDSVWSFSQTWLWMAAVLWIAMNGVLHAVLLPAEKAAAAGDDTARKRVDSAGAALTVLLVVMMYLMIFKPGL
jgi:uncharacterized membrane protein